MARRTTQGVLYRHSRECIKQERQDDCGNRCSDSATPWEAWVYSKRDKKKIRQRFDSQAAAKGWRIDAMKAVKDRKLRATVVQDAPPGSRRMARRRSRRPDPQSAEAAIQAGRTPPLQDVARPTGPSDTRRSSARRHRPRRPPGAQRGAPRRRLLRLDDQKHVHAAAGCLPPRCPERHGADEPRSRPRAADRCQPRSGSDPCGARNCSTHSATTCGHCGQRRSMPACAAASCRRFGHGTSTSKPGRSASSTAGTRSRERSRRNQRPGRARCSFSRRCGRSSPRSSRVATRTRSSSAPVCPHSTRDRPRGSRGERGPRRTRNVRNEPSAAEKEAEPVEWFGLHEARHSFSTFMDHAGVSETRADRYMGHSARGVAGRYRHLLPGQIAEDARTGRRVPRRYECREGGRNEASRRGLARRDARLSLASYRIGGASRACWSHVQVGLPLERPTGALRGALRSNSRVEARRQTLRSRSWCR